MPAFTIPRHVSAHRISAIALYRALLQQCRAVPLPVESKEELQNIVRNRFKQIVHLHSYPRLKLSFQAGYEAVDRLDAAVAGDEDSTRYIASLLARTPEKTKAAPPRHVLPKEKRKSSSDDTPATGEKSAPPFKPSDELFSRPHPLSRLPGKRHVPVLFNANRIPVLRIKKPQPESLSSVIKNILKTRQKRTTRHHWLTDQLRFAQYEDMWDHLIEETAREGQEDREKENEPAKDPPWAEEFEVALEDVESKIQEERAKNIRTAKAMLAVVDREKKAYAKEREERRQAKEQARSERRKVREAECEPQG